MAFSKNDKTTTAGVPQRSAEVREQAVSSARAWPKLLVRGAVAVLAIDAALHASHVNLAFAFAGVIATITGLALAFASLRILRNHGTSEDCTMPTTQLVTEGPYRVSRNPLYLSYTLLMIGLSAISQTPLSVFVTAAVIVGLYVIALKEETYLLDRFGEDFSDYSARVRRWL